MVAIDIGFPSSASTIRPRINLLTPFQLVAGSDGAVFEFVLHACRIALLGSSSSPRSTKKTKFLQAASELPVFIASKTRFDCARIRSTSCEFRLLETATQMFPNRPKAATKTPITKGLIHGELVTSLSRADTSRSRAAISLSRRSSSRCRAESAAARFTDSAMEAYLLRHTLHTSYVTCPHSAFLPKYYT
jgi:hypothetical protein